MRMGYKSVSSAASTSRVIVLEPPPTQRYFTGAVPEVVSGEPRNHNIMTLSNYYWQLLQVRIVSGLNQSLAKLPQ